MQSVLIWRLVLLWQAIEHGEHGWGARPGGAGRAPLARGPTPPRAKWLRGQNGSLLGQSLELLGAPLELLGASLELRGASLELRGASLELLGVSLELLGATLELQCLRVVYY